MKNYADIYNSANDAISLEQRWYLKNEATRGVHVAPTNSDLILALPGGAIAYEQPFESSPQRSGRHHNGIIKKKKATNWSFSTYFNIDQAAVSGTLSVDTGVKLLWKSLLGRETVSGSAVYDAATAPNTTFTLYEVGDKWARQSVGAFVLGGNVQLPGDGEAMTEWTGAAKNAVLCGIAKSTTDNDGGNTVTLVAGEADRIPVGAQVMLIEANGTTRSADTPVGSPRKVTDVTGNIVTVDGAALADADGSGGSAPLYLCYYEPDAPTAIDSPTTGLIGSISVAGLPAQCIRNLSVNMQNNHELVDYCFGADGLDGTLFVPGDRLTAEVTMSLNLNHEVAEFFNRVQEFESQDISAILGPSAARYFGLDLPRVFFSVPGFSVPDTGSIPVEFSGTAYQTALDAADEVTAGFY